MKIALRLFVITIILAGISCRKDKPVSYLEDHGYPKEVRDIMLSSCAVEGCHNNKSKDAANGLDLSSWDKLFEGGRNGAAVIPFNLDQSFLFHFVNTFPELGPGLEPTMPLNKPHLSKSQVETIRDWILNGAPNENGSIKFEGNPERKKIYVANQGCDQVAVYDAETKLIMRYVKVGNDPLVIEAPHMIRLSPDGLYWYVAFTRGKYFQRFKTSDDSFAGEAEITEGNWNTFSISADSRIAYCVDWSGNGKVAVVDLLSMTRTALWQSAGQYLTYPHGSVLADHDSTLYITAQTGNFLYKIHIYDDVSDPDIIRLDPNSFPNTGSSLDPHEMVFSPDKSEYFVACQKSNEIRAFKASNDSLLAVIPVGAYPQEPMISSSTDYLFVSCMEDVINNSRGRGSVAIINYKTHQLVKHISSSASGPFLFQPHGLAVDDEKGLVYVASRNQTSGGPAPHHSGVCLGKNGYVSIIDMNNLELINYRSETIVDPFSIVVRN